MVNINQFICMSAFFVAICSVSEARSESPPAYSESKTYFIQADEPSYDLSLVYVYDTTNEVVIHPVVDNNTVNALVSDITYDIPLLARIRPDSDRPELSDFGDKGIVRNNGPPINTA